ncbi:MAG TPA: small ribosomal subunit Rsm22 family protein [Holophagaceae bacterium]|nr:small ribosomal subunit Rsm22 family protein [Holophagaceae bacterium]
MIHPDSGLLGRLRTTWEAALPVLRATQPAAWAPALRRLSDRFNRIEGAPEGDYFDADNVEPYLAHHGWAQAEALAWIAAERPGAFEGKRLVWDLGGGPGVLTLAASVLLPNARFVLTDLRAPALHWAEARLRPLGVDLTTQVQRLPELPAGAPDLVLIGHVLNELPPATQARLLEALKARLAPGGTILILEPALLSQTRRLMELREAFLAAPWSLQAPCPCPGPCPMLALPKQWCVAELPWEPPAWFRTLDVAAGLDRRQLRFAYLLAQRDVPAPGPRARIVGLPPPQKGKVQRWACTPTGGEVWEALARHGEPPWALPRTEEIELPPGLGAPRPQGGTWPLRRWEP